MLINIRKRIESRVPQWLRLALAQRVEQTLDSQFLASGERKTAFREHHERCAVLEHFIDFAKLHFDLNQKKREITGLLDLLSARDLSVIGEIGTYRCGNLYLLASQLHSLQKIIAVDRVFRQKAMYDFLFNGIPATHFIRGNSHTRGTVSNVKKQLKGKQFDFLFIDGDHSYEGAKADFLAYKMLVKDGGLIAFHDIVPDLTTRMNSEVPLSKCFAGGVPILWAEVKTEYPSYEFIEHPEQDGFGIGVIEYSRSALDRPGEKFERGNG
jgi:cephalosporin hydroxylase